MSFSFHGSVPSKYVGTRTQQVQELARQMWECYGLQDWTFAFNRRKTHMGLCLYGPRVIELSVHFIARNGDDLIRDTLLHEIAHALVGPGQGHNWVWREKCLEIGARPERLCFEVEMPEGLWQARCGWCGMVHHKHRRPKHMVGWFCRHCGKERGQLIWEHAC